MDDIQSDDPATSESGDFVTERVVYHIESQAAVVFRVRWCDYFEEDDTWEPPGHIPRSALLTYYRHHVLSLTPTHSAKPNGVAHMGKLKHQWETKK